MIPSDENDLKPVLDRIENYAIAHDLTAEELEAMINVGISAVGLITPDLATKIKNA